MTREHELELLTHCLKLMKEMRAELREYNRVCRERLQGWERDRLHAQWREDNREILLLTNS